MIKLFRNIRQKLIKEGKTTNYFKYAVGEIVLVVIGILIALQINNWNEDNINKNVELDYMQNMIEDLKDDLKLYDDYNHSNLVIYSLIDSIIPAIKSKDRKHYVSETAYWSRLITMEWIIIHPVERTYEQMKSSGHLRLIRNRNVADAISKYYSSLSKFEGYNEAGMLWAAEYVKSMGRIFDAELLRNIMMQRKQLPATSEDMLTEDPITINEFINSIQYFNGALTLGDGVSKSARERAEYLIHLIEKNYIIK